MDDIVEIAESITRDLIKIQDARKAKDAQHSAQPSKPGKKLKQFKNGAAHVFADLEKTHNKVQSAVSSQNAKSSFSFLPELSAFHHDEHRRTFEKLGKYVRMERRSSGLMVVANRH
ncbi:hypothetical protein M3Y99_00184700 [Aphelenchoides fujianensis]|nr:hypothetical protein M3Y99_00184700 [Aphelenchoides fujianensis]